MTAVVTMGGKGRRMRPINSFTSKNMIKLCGRPLVSYSLDKAVKAGASSVTAAGGNCDVLRELLPAEIAVNGTPPCTYSGAAIRSAINSAGTEEDIMIFCSDTLCDADCRNVYEKHILSGTDITLLCLHESGCFAGNTEDMIRIDENGRILTDTVGGYIFGGIIILSPKAAEYIRKCAAKSDTDMKGFIELLNMSGLNVSADIRECMFADINTPDDLLAAEKAVIRKKFVPETAFEKNTFIHSENEYENVSIKSPSYIGSGCIIGAGTEISADTSIGSFVSVGKNVRIENSIVMNGAYIGDNVHLYNCTVCENARLMRSVHVMSGAVVGRDSCIGSGSVVRNNVRVGCGINVPSEIFVRSDLVNGGSNNLRFDSSGSICGETNALLTPAAASAAGSAAAVLYSRICCGYSGDNASNALMSAFAAGVSAAGGKIILAGKITAPGLAYAVKQTHSGCGVHISGGVNTSLSICAADGLPPDESDRQFIENASFSGEYRRVGYNHFGDISYCHGLSDLYFAHIESIADLPHGENTAVRRGEVRLNCPNDIIYSACAGLLRKTAPMIKDDCIVFRISGSGKEVSAYTEDTGYISDEKLVMLCILYNMKYEHTVTAVSSRIPYAADSIAEKYGGTLLRYSSSPDRRRMSPEAALADSKARAAAVRTAFAEDGCAVMFTVLKLIERENKTLRELCAELPEYSSIQRIIPINGHSDDIFRRLCMTSGSCEDTAGSRITLRPVRTGGGMMMYIESAAAETAEELCGFYEDLIRTADSNCPKIR